MNVRQARHGPQALWAAESLYITSRSACRLDQPRPATRFTEQDMQSRTESVHAEFSIFSCTSQSLLVDRPKPLLLSLTVFAPRGSSD